MLKIKLDKLKDELLIELQQETSVHETIPLRKHGPQPDSPAIEADLDADGFVIAFRMNRLAAMLKELAEP